MGVEGYFGFVSFRIGAYSGGGFFAFCGLPMVGEGRWVFRLLYILLHFVDREN